MVEMLGVCAAIVMLNRPVVAGAVVAAVELTMALTSTEVSTGVAAGKVMLAATVHPAAGPTTEISVYRPHREV